MTKKIRLVISVVIPIVALISLALIKRNIFVNGREVVLPIEGYDPRDVLSGHYVTYRINYGVDNVCREKHHWGTAYVCLEPKKFSLGMPTDCKITIKGTCNGETHRFHSELERFYIPESRAEELTQKIMNKKASIVLAVLPNATAVVKDLLIEGKSWKE